MSELTDRLVEAAASALRSRPVGEDALDVAEDVLAAVLPLLADAVEASRAEARRGAHGYAVGNETFNEGIEAAADLIREATP